MVEFFRHFLRLVGLKNHLGTLKDEKLAFVRCWKNKVVSWTDVKKVVCYNLDLVTYDACVVDVYLRDDTRLTYSELDFDLLKLSEILEKYLHIKIEFEMKLFLNTSQVGDVKILFELE